MPSWCSAAPSAAFSAAFVGGGLVRGLREESPGNHCARAPVGRREITASSSTRKATK